MAETGSTSQGNEVGLSVRLPDGTLVWSKRTEWALVLKDVETIFGPDAFVALTEMLLEGIKKPATVTPIQTKVAPEPSGSGSEGQTAEGDYETCPVHGVPKDRWVPPGVSKSSGRKYSGFFGCPVPGCRGR